MTDKLVCPSRVTHKSAPRVLPDDTGQAPDKGTLERQVHYATQEEKDARARPRRVRDLRALLVRQAARRVHRGPGARVLGLGGGPRPHRGGHLRRPRPLGHERRAPGVPAHGRRRALGQLRHGARLQARPLRARAASRAASTASASRSAAWRSSQPWSRSPRAPRASSSRP